MRNRAAATLILFFAVVPALQGQTSEEADRVRRQMVSEFIEKEGIHNPRVLDAMRTVPRHEFVPPALRPNAYIDAALSIGYKQTISPPFVVAYMTESLDPQPTDRVLEIGTGSGYQAAVLSGLVKEVYSIEIVEPLGKAAGKQLRQLGYRNVKTKIGDGYLGWAEHAPFDKIIVTCSPERVPRPLIDQLKEGGQLIIPLGEGYHQDIYLLEKKAGRLFHKQLIPTLFVPMTGRAEGERSVKADPLEPRINNGGFEIRGSDGEPTGWHYQRQLSLVDHDAPEGRFCARFENEDPGRPAQALQGMAIDGQRIKALRFALMVRADRIVDGSEPYQRAGLVVHFYDDNRRLLADATAAHWIGTTPWRNVNATVAVPKAAREAIVRLGLTGATGRLFVDDVRMWAVKNSK